VGEKSAKRTTALVAAGAILIGSLGPWTTFAFGSVSGMQGDGRITVVLALIAGCLLLMRWGLTAAVVVAAISAIVSVYDVINVSTSTQEIFGREVHLVDVGWGLWVAALGSVVLLVSSYLFRAETRGQASIAPVEETPAPGESSP